MKDVIIIPNKNKDIDLKCSNFIKETFNYFGYNAQIVEGQQFAYGNYKFDTDAKDIEYVVSVGGDGTFLQVIHGFCEFKRIKFIGVNLGTLGFLTNIEKDHLEEQLKRILLHDDFILKEYQLLSVFDNQTCNTDKCLNDIVIGRNGFARVINFEVKVDGNLLYEFGGDGLLIANSVGSTAYNLSLGGPLVHPASKVMIINPIAPHSIKVKPVIVPITSKIEVKMLGSHKPQKDESIITCDGRYQGMNLSAGDSVVISGSTSILVVSFPEDNYFKNLTQKFN